MTSVDLWDLLAESAKSDDKLAVCLIKRSILEQRAIPDFAAIDFPAALLELLQYQDDENVEEVVDQVIDSFPVLQDVKLQQLRLTFGMRPSRPSYLPPRTHLFHMNNGTTITRPQYRTIVESWIKAAEDLPIFYQVKFRQYLYHMERFEFWDKQEIQAEGIMLNVPQEGVTSEMIRCFLAKLGRV